MCSRKTTRGPERLLSRGASPRVPGEDSAEVRGGRSYKGGRILSGGEGGGGDMPISILKELSGSHKEALQSPKEDGSSLGLHWQ